MVEPTWFRNASNCAGLTTKQRAPSAMACSRSSGETEDVITAVGTPASAGFFEIADRISRASPRGRLNRSGTDRERQAVPVGNVEPPVPQHPQYRNGLDCN